MSIKNVSNKTFVFSLLFAVYFMTGYAFLHTSSSFALHAAVIAVVFFSASFTLIRYVTSPNYTNIADRISLILPVALHRYIFPLLIFLYLYGWWFAAGIQSWKYPLFCLPGIVMIIFAMVVSIVGGIFIETAPANKDSRTDNTPGDSGKTSINLRKYSAILTLIFLVTFRIMAGLTNNTGVSSYEQSAKPANNSGDILIIALDDVDLNTIVNLAAQQKLPNLSRLIGNSVVGILSTPDTNSPVQNWKTIFSGIYKDNTATSVQSNFPVDGSRYMSLRTFGLSDLLKSLVFMNDLSIVRLLKDRKNDPEFLWDTAERYNVKTGIINMPFSQRTTQGFYISSRYFTEGSNDPESIKKNLGNVYPENINYETGTSLMQSAQLVEFNKDCSADNIQASSFFEHATGLAHVSRTLAENHCPGILTIMLSGRFQSKSNTLLTIQEKYSIIDAFVGYCIHHAPQNYTKFIIIGCSHDTEKDSFILYNIPERQFVDKTVSIDLDKVCSDLLYMTGLPLLDKKSPGINKDVFHHANISARPPRFVRYYPPFLPE